MQMNELPLQELFTRLREAGLVLGIDEYQLLLQSLQGGFGIADKVTLKRLCQTLWVKSAEGKAVLEYHFEQVMGSEAVVSTSETNSNTFVPIPEVKSESVVQISEVKSKTAVPTEEKLPKQSGHYKSSQIITYVTLSILGVGIVWGIVLSQQQQTSTQKPTPTPTPTHITKPKQEGTQSNLIIWSLLSVAALSTGYLIFRWIAKRNAEQYNDYKNFAPKDSTPSDLAPALASERMTQQPVGDNTFVEEATPNLPASRVTSKLIQTREDEIQVVKSVLRATNKHLTRDFFPITQRQMKQMWRYLRRPVREGKATELDVEATVNQIGHKGILLEPVLVPPRVNRAELLLLIDQDGSMVPFHTLSHRLAETALRGGRLGSAGIYYFHNCPVEYLYRDPYHQQGELVSDIVTHVCSEQTAVLIFSDAGAARRGYSEERYKLTKEFLAQLQQQVRYIAWLNPMPRKRWFGTTADKIVRLVPMFEVSRAGLQDAISVLRGRPTNFEGRGK
ncbi:hypothetical protein [Calothrix rhizosoleniae]|uniref:hypothetical protein n=1 Tax=Calothrix rhizosoleniae TaxID=888997 RepID=UPI001F3B9A47|nr:hypothetical protein [Calothrix rhizosoleniae]